MMHYAPLLASTIPTIVAGALSPLFGALVLGGFWWLWRKIKSELAAGHDTVMASLTCLQAQVGSHDTSIDVLEKGAEFMRGQMSAVLAMGTTTTAAAAAAAAAAVLATAATAAQKANGN